MTSRFSPPELIRDDRPKSPKDGAFCPACGGDFMGRCRRCGVARVGGVASPQSPLPATAAMALAFSLSVLEAAADPYELMTSWRHALPPGGLLRLTPAADAPLAVWRIPKRALLLLAERAGFRLVGRGWLRKTWLFRRY